MTRLEGISIGLHVGVPGTPRDHGMAMQLSYVVQTMTRTSIWALRVHIHVIDDI